MLNLIGCLDRPTSGQISIGGRNTVELPASQRAGLRAVIPVLSAIENVELPLILRGVRAKERGRRTAGLLEAVGLGDRLRQRPSELWW